MPEAAFVPEKPRRHAVPPSVPATMAGAARLRTGALSSRGQTCSARPMSDPTDAELAARYRPRLLTRSGPRLAEASDATRDDRRPVELDQQAVGRLSRMDALQGQAMARGLEARRGARGRAIAAALLRIDDGEFGYCEDCGGVHRQRPPRRRPLRDALRVLRRLAPVTPRGPGGRPPRAGRAPRPDPGSAPAKA
jgi:DnaK suppressor protein